MLYASIGTAALSILTFSVIFIESIAFLGLFLLPVIPLSLAYSVELTFTEVPEPVSNGMLILFSYLISQPLAYILLFTLGIIGT